MNGVKFLKLLICLVLLSSSYFCRAQLEHIPRTYSTPKVEPLENVELQVYPPFWWSDMEMDTIELIFHGTNVGNARLQLDKEGMEILQIDTVENSNYLFVKVTIDKQAKAGIYRFSVQNENKSQTLDFRVLGQKQHQPAGLSSSDVIYLIMPDRFANADTSNDVVESMNENEIHRERILGRHGGDLRGIMAHLNYLDDLGITALWLNPVQENDQFHESYHGYAITDHYQIDPRLGSNQLYRKLVDSCHQRNMKVVMDVVLNHCGDQHFMVRDLPEKDWVFAHDQFKRSNFRATTQMDPYGSIHDQKEFEQGWFDIHMPDLNQKNPRVARFLIQNSIWWVEYAGIDAFRIDTYPYSVIDFSNKWVSALLNEYPGLALFGETWVHNIPIQAFFSEKNRLFKNGSIAPALTDFQIHFALIDALTEAPDWKEGVSSLYYVLAQDFMYAHPERHVIFLDNHDLNRIWTVLDQNMDKYIMGITLLLTTRGIPMIYYGTEVLLEGQGGAFGEHGRIDFPGGWSQDEISKFNEKGRDSLENEAFQFMRSLLSLRKENPVLHKGQLLQYIPQNGLYVYFRISDEKRFMVIVNTGDSAVIIQKKRYYEGLENATHGFDHIAKESVRFDELSVSPAQTLLIEIDDE